MQAGPWGAVPVYGLHPATIQHIENMLNAGWSVQQIFGHLQASIPVHADQCAANEVWRSGFCCPCSVRCTAQMACSPHRPRLVPRLPADQLWLAQRSGGVQNVHPPVMTLQTVPTMNAPWTQPSGSTQPANPPVTAWPQPVTTTIAPLTQHTGSVQLQTIADTARQISPSQHVHAARSSDVAAMDLWHIECKCSVILS